MNDRISSLPCSVGLASLVVVLASLAPAPVEACSGCVEFGVAPRLPTRPADLAGIRRNPSDGSEVGLRDLETNLDVPLSTTLIEGVGVDFYPTDALVPGRAYSFELGESWCGPEALAINFTASDPLAPSLDLSSSLGALSLEVPSRSVIDVAGSPACSEQIEVLFAKLTLDLDPALAQVEPLLLYATLVDGEPWSHEPRDYFPIRVGESWLGRGTDGLFTSCPNGGDGLGPGTHEVQMIAEIAGLPGVVFESEVAVIDFDCTIFDEPSTDASEGGDSGNFVAPVDDPGPRGGCGCASGDAHDMGWLLGLPSLLILFGIRARGMGRSPNPSLDESSRISARRSRPAG